MGILAGMPYLIMALLGASFLWGSIMVFRGRKWWASWLMLIGSSGQVIGALALVGGMVVMFSRVASASGSASSMSSGMAGGMIVMSVGMICLGLGFLLFVAGFIGLAARFGATEHRAAELEGMVQGLQERMEEPR